MSLPSLQLDAFFEVAQTGSFSAAAKNLNVTQSALSQRILNLEDDLGTTLLIREPGGARVTETGDELLRFCRIKRNLEEELNMKLQKKSQDGLSGTIRIGGYSTVMRSVVMRCLDSLIQTNPNMHLELMVREMRELHSLLRRGEVDFVILDHKLENSGFESHVLGEERHVLIEPKRKNNRKNMFLDHDSEDLTTMRFLKKHPQIGKEKIDRSFLDEIYGIIDGVVHGWGSAVVPLHLVDTAKVTIRKSFSPLVTSVVLHHYTQPYYTKLHEAVVKSLVNNAPQFLNQ